MVLASSKRKPPAEMAAAAATNNQQLEGGDFRDYNQIKSMQKPFSYFGGATAANRPLRPPTSNDQQDHFDEQANFSSSVSSSGYTSAGQASQKYNNTNLSSASSINPSKRAGNSHAPSLSNGLTALLQRAGRNFRRQPIAAPMATSPPMVPMMIDDDDDDNLSGEEEDDATAGEVIDGDTNNNGARFRDVGSRLACHERRRPLARALIDGASDIDDDYDADAQSRSFSQVRNFNQHQPHSLNAQLNQGHRRHNLSRSYQHIGDCADSEVGAATYEQDQPINETRYLQQYYHHQPNDDNSFLKPTYAALSQHCNQIHVHNAIYKPVPAIARHPNQQSQSNANGHFNAITANQIRQQQRFQQCYQPVKHFQIPQQLSYSYHHLAQYNNNILPSLKQQEAAYISSQSEALDDFQKQWTGIETGRRRNQSNSTRQQQQQDFSSDGRSSNKMQASRQHLTSPPPVDNLQHSNSSSGISSSGVGRGSSRRKGTGTPHKSPNRNTYNKRSTTSHNSSSRVVSSKKQHSDRQGGGGKHPPVELGCCGKMAKLILFMINMLFWSSGIALGAWGILTLVEDHKYNLSQLLVFEHGSRTSLFQLLSWSFITLGCATILVGFCGCSALFKNNRWILGLYIFLILAIFALDLATGLLAIIFQERLVANVRLRLGNKLRSEYGVQASFTAAIDYIQTRYECCGLEGHFDYDQSLWRLQRLGGFEATVARTCCHLRNTFDDQAHVNPRPVNESMCQSTDVRFHQSYRYRKGCFDELERLIRHKIWTFTTACGAVGGVILLSLIFATCFCRSISSQSSRKSSASSGQDQQQNHSTEGKKIGASGSGGHPEPRQSLNPYRSQ